MDIFFEDHRKILEALILHKVNFILVGGYAVIYHGYHRTTGDLDIWVEPSNANKEKLFLALTELDYDSEGLDIINEWDFTQPQIFFIGNPPDRTDFMTHISGVSYNDAIQKVIYSNIDSLNLPFIHINQLIENKESSRRFKDLDDVEKLRKIIMLKNKR